MRLPVLAAAIAAFAPSTAHPQAPAAAPSPARAVQVVDRVSVIDGTGRGAIRDAVVVIEDGRIRAVGPRATTPIPSGAARIDGGGGYLLPGFIEMHAHTTLGPVELDRSSTPPTLRALADPEVSRRTLALLLANGITTARDPGGPAARTVPLRDSVARGALAGPRLYVAGDIIDALPLPGLSATVKTVDDVRKEVRRQAALGVDMVKLYAFLAPELVEAGVDEAHRMGIPAIAHVMQTTWTQAARSGLDGIVHVLGWSGALLPSAARPRYAAMMTGTQFMYGWLELMDLDAPEMNEAIAAMAQRGMHLDPTLVVFERAVRGDEPAVTNSPHLADASPLLVGNWQSFFTFNAGWTTDDYARARAAWPKALQLTRRLYDRGVLLTAGTDANNPWTVPGESYHRELELLVEAGIPPLDVLSIATRNGARALGIIGDVGTVEVGKRADLVLIRKDPVANISATREIVWTMRGGARTEPLTVLRAAGLRP